MSSVIVVGSANVDQVFRVERIPSPGETVLSTGFSTARGGKGQNQAVAAARAGAPTAFIAALGDDAFGSDTRAGLIDDGVDVTGVRSLDAATGTALIAVDSVGENTIIVEAGANRLLVDLQSADAAAIAASSVLAMQLEIPLETVIAAARIARAADTTVMLNAAPIRDLPAELLSSLDILVVNEHEASHLAGERDWRELTEQVPVVVVTLGSEGALLLRRGSDEVRVAAPSVHAVDATGAGDTFCGAFAAGLAEDMELEQALRFAVTAASLSVQSYGAVPSIPLRAQIDAATTR
ncbi:MAG TPA: ribokinase [Rhodoglobus sp.]|nr:ribokinase [Rhodoglobus sp.]HQA22287.1 ribokinase [Rhodoglobus sp.]HQG68878.1 ribokinase [Rhodoglobus sp.]HQJ34019.1 ribokinase [Rhodoglobus sp.]